ncbi:MAG TPA: hypothetical protein VE309_05815 [Caulobacteraceae bacterium]|jgi:hypothetical protein|nr:hypothetical protein [Caulobacteraceae bacterium]
MKKIVVSLFVVGAIALSAGSGSAYPGGWRHYHHWRHCGWRHHHRWCW